MVRSLRAQPKATPQRIVWVQACKSSRLQTLSVGSKSQVIGAKEQGPKRACVLRLPILNSQVLIRDRPRLERKVSSAYHERRKEHDLSLEAFRDFLLKKGHKVD